ncbi:MAG: LamG-like jellyroll fold domain-containing protein [Planctomycetota bacterium]|jgi:hypothetical protein
MSKKLFILTSFVLVLGLAVGVANAAPLNQDPGPNGIVSVEAENFDDNVEVGGHKWEETGPTGGFTGVAGLRAPSGHQTNYAANSERLEYEIDFVKTGTYYPWILAWGPDGNSDTCHVGLDGEEIPTSDQMVGWDLNYSWSNDTRPASGHVRGSFEVTSAGVHTLNIWARENGLIIDKIVLTTNPDYTLTGTEPGPPESPRGARAIAFDPNPADGAIDVPRDVVLSWTPGAFVPPINGHKVYFSENFNDVSGGIGGITQDASSYAPVQRLDFSTTYYWRVDEVNGPPDNTVYEGGLWSFTTEPLAYAIENITATASSAHQADMGPENTINGSGLDENDLHSAEATDMWLSGNEPLGAWIEYEFDKVYKLHQLWIWNSNQTIESLVGFGLKDVTIEHSTNGTDYTTLADVLEFAQAPGTDGYAHNTTVDFVGVEAKYVRLTAASNRGFLPQYGLSELRFFYIPVTAREPSPDSGATDVNVDVVLSWRAGREAITHDVYLSTDEQAVIDGTAPVISVTEASHGPLSLDLGKIYYWRVDEVNEAEIAATWQGDLWDFTTQEYFVVDDFESYNDLDPTDPESNRIFNVWLDGYEQPTNGSLVGYDVPPFCEQSNVHSGKQAMPFFFSNTVGAAYSEAELTLSPPDDWTKHGIKTLSLWFSGDASNTAAQLYVKVNGSKVTYDGDAGNLTVAAWQPWNIDLASLGVGLQSVTKLAIGIDGNGAAGTLLFDDIRLYPYDRQLITPAEPSNAGLAGHYKLDQDATDSSGNNNHGTLGGDPQWTAGKISGALDFDGDDYVDCGNPSQLDFGTGSWSVSAWIKMPASTDNRNIFAKGGDSGGGIRYMLNVSETDDHKACLTVDDNVTKVQSTSSVTVDDDQWHHIVGIRDGSSLRLYVDGVQERAPVALSDGYDLSGTSQANAYIGAGWNFETSVVQKFFIGLIDDVRIYNQALSQEEITWLAGRTLPFDKPF